MSQNCFAKQIGISQPRLSEWLSCKMKRTPLKAKKALIIIENYRNQKYKTLPQVIEKSIRRIWDGTEQHAIAIACVIESLENFKQK